MPTFSFRCNDCESKFDYFSKSVNMNDDVNCPECSSVSTRKIMSAPNISMNTFKSSAQSVPNCSTGGCSSGMCGFN